ncbi:MAG: hypothetical protein JXJ22_14710 [Bacteroidales bacterium]|nr:hypothetical protein [Bacteroidales bacterium]
MSLLDNNDDFFDKVQYFVETPVAELIQGKKNKQGSRLNFHELIDGFKDFQNILKHIKKDNILILPEFKISELQNLLNPLFNNVIEIQNKEKKENEPDEAQKHLIIKFFTLPINIHEPDRGGYFASKKEKIWNIIVQSIALSNDNVKTVKEVRSIVSHLQDMRKEAEQDMEVISNVLDSAQTELSKEGVSTHAKSFNEQAEKHRKNAKNWKYSSFALIILTIAIVIFFFLIITNKIDETEIRKLIETSILATIIISILTFSLTLTIKNYFAEKHNESINQHKANCLSTFNTFIDSADQERKQAILLQATQTIFSHQSSGFLSKENDVQNPNPIVEIVRNIAGKQNPLGG